MCHPTNSITRFLTLHMIPTWLVMSDMQYWVNYSRMILHIIQISLRWIKKSISAPFPVYEIMKISFPVFFNSTNNAEFNLRGSHKGDFQDPRMACASKIDVWPLLTSLAKNCQLVWWLLTEVNTAIMKQKLSTSVFIATAFHLEIDYKIITAWK